MAVSLTDSDLQKIQLAFRTLVNASTSLSGSFEDIISTQRTNTNTNDRHTNSTKANTKAVDDNTKSMFSSQKSYEDTIKKLNEFQKTVENNKKAQDEAVKNSKRNADEHEKILNKMFSGVDTFETYVERARSEFIPRTFANLGKSLKENLERELATRDKVFSEQFDPMSHLKDFDKVNSAFNKLASSLGSSNGLITKNNYELVKSQLEVLKTSNVSVEHMNAVKNLTADFDKLSGLIGSKLTNQLEENAKVSTLITRKASLTAEQAQIFADISVTKSDIKKIQQTNAKLSSAYSDFFKIIDPLSNKLSSDVAVFEKQDAITELSDAIVDVATQMKNAGVKIPYILTRDLNKAVNMSKFNADIMRVADELSKSHNLITSSNKQMIQDVVDIGDKLGIVDKTFIELSHEIKRTGSAVIAANDAYVRDLEAGVDISSRRAKRAQAHQVDPADFDFNSIKNTISRIRASLATMSYELQSPQNVPKAPPEVSVFGDALKSLNSIVHQYSITLDSSMQKMDANLQPQFGKNLANALTSELKNTSNTVLSQLAVDFSRNLVNFDDVQKLRKFIELQNESASGIVNNNMVINDANVETIEQQLRLGRTLGYTSSTFTALTAAVEDFRTNGISGSINTTMIDQMINEQTELLRTIEEINRTTATSTLRNTSVASASLRQSILNSLGANSPFGNLISDMADIHRRGGGGGPGGPGGEEMAAAFGRFNNNMVTRLIPALTAIGKVALDTFTREYDLLINNATELDRTTALMLRMTERQYSELMTKNKQVWTAGEMNQETMNDWMRENYQTFRHTYGSSPELIGEMQMAMKQLQISTGMTDDQMEKMMMQIKATGVNTGIANDEFTKMIGNIVASSESQILLSNLNKKDRETRLENIRNTISLNKHLGWTSEAAEQFTSALNTAGQGLGPSELITNKATALQLSAIIGTMSEQSGVERKGLSPEQMDKFSRAVGTPEIFKSEEQRKLISETELAIADFKAEYMRKMGATAENMSDEQREVLGMAMSQFTDIISKIQGQFSEGYKTAGKIATEQELKRLTGAKPELVNQYDNLYGIVNDMQKKKIAQLEQEDSIWHHVLDNAAEFSRAWDAAKGSSVGSAAGSLKDAALGVAGNALGSFLGSRLGASAAGAAAGAGAGGAAGAGGGFLSSLLGGAAGGRSGLFKKLLGGVAGAGLAAWGVMSASSVSGDMRGGMQDIDGNFTPGSKAKIENNESMKPTEKMAKIELQDQSNQFLAALEKLNKDNSGQNGEIADAIRAAAAQFEKMNKTLVGWDKWVKEQLPDKLTIPDINQKSDQSPITDGTK